MSKDSNVERVIPVLVPTPSERPYSYAVPDGMQVEPGSIVRVPLGPREIYGVAWDGQPEKINSSRLRKITKVFDCPPLKPEIRRFIDWVSAYTLTPPGMVARMVLRVPAAFDPEPPLEGFCLKQDYDQRLPERMTPARHKVLKHAQLGLSWTRSGLSHAAGVSLAVVDGLIAQGIFDRVQLPPQAVVAVPDTLFGSPSLSDDQQRVADRLREKVKENHFSTTLLDGVTGSGKTEVYFEAVAQALDQGKQVLILLPEIALTQIFLDRFHDRFGTRPAEWHSDLAPKKRERIWRQVASGQVRVVAGARSALFLPFTNLGLIIVDEEHDSAYKQEDRVFYNARDMSIVRGHLGGFPVVLASATPSLETRFNADQGRYERLILQQRFASAALPKLAPIDMRRSPPRPGEFLSPALLESMQQTFDRKEQSLLFLNRRGYAPLTLCRVCGHRFQCGQCSSWLVEHRFRKQLICHQCGHNEPQPEACPECGTLDHLVPCGPGVERIAEEVDRHFPKARTIVLSSDMLGGVKRLRLELEAIANGDVDIVVGTQLVAKGHNFPAMTLVGVIDADLGLSNGDPRAAERTFQLLNQVTGRAGRTGLQSRGLIQTYQPEHPVIQAIVSGDTEAFYQRETTERRLTHLPPFGRLAAIIISAGSKPEAEIHARELRRAAARNNEIEVLGPAEAPLALVAGRYRFRLLIHGARRSNIQIYIRNLLEKAPKPRGSVRVQVDIDPQSFL